MTANTCVHAALAVVAPILGNDDTMSYLESRQDDRDEWGAVANGDASGVTGSHITERASNRTSTSSHENDSDMSLTIHYSLSVSV